METDLKPDTTTEQPSQKLALTGWPILVAWMAVVFVLSNFFLPGLLPGGLFAYVVRPVLWLSMGVLALLLYRRTVKIAFPETLVQLGWLKRKDVLLNGAMLGGMQVAAGILLGLLLGFGNSPYAHTLGMIALNLWYIFSGLFGLETARWYLGKVAGGRHHALGYFLAWLLPLVLLIPVGKYSLFASPGSAFEMVGRTLLPEAAESMLATSLAILGGPLASIAYRGVMELFEWLSPILPDLTLLAAAFVGVIVPVFGLVILNSVPESKTDEKKEGASPAAWLLVGVIAVVLIWMNTGVFGIQPSLMSGPSMNPTLWAGDVVIVREVAPETIQIGDIIRFHRDSIDVVHRVKEIQNEGGQISFITRGDNNNVDDEPVSTEMCEGKVIFTIPKIGYISIWLRQAITKVGGLL